MLLEQTRIAASADGYDVQLDLYPDGLGGAVARRYHCLAFFSS